MQKRFSVERPVKAGAVLSFGIGTICVERGVAGACGHLGAYLPSLALQAASIVVQNAENHGRLAAARGWMS
jgi:hypothetical protein